jgi:uncharacterized protein (DUF305 family)
MSMIATIGVKTGHDGEMRAPDSNDGPDDGGTAVNQRIQFSPVQLIAGCLVFALAGFGVARFLGRDDGPSHNAVDIGFLRDMMDHHEQAIEMSVTALRRAESSDIRQEALNIILGQRGEYVQMLDRLRAYGVADDQPDDMAMGWMGMSPVPVAEMPGLASEAEMRKLKDATGKDVDIVFATLMIKHHRAGAEMAQYAVDNAEDTFAIGLASQMVQTQELEIADLRKFAKMLGTEIPDPGPVMSDMDMDHGAGSDHSTDGEADHSTDGGVDDANP